MPQLVRFEIEGRDAIPFLKDQTLSIEPQVNGRIVADVTFLDRFDRPNYLVDIFRPEKRDTFIVEFDDGRRYGGIVWDIIAREHLVPGVFDSGLRSQLRLLDWESLLDVVPFNEPVAGGTLLSQIEAVIDNLAAHGITLSPDQAAGPTLGAQIFAWRTMRQVFDELSLQSTWFRQIDADGVLIMQPPGGLVSATPIRELEGNFRSMRLEDTLNDYRNGVYVRYGPQGILPKTELFEGDGTTRRFTLTYQLSITGTGVTPAGYVTVTRTGPSVSLETVDAEPVTGPAQWHYDAAALWNNAIEQDAGEVVLGVGETVEVAYNAVFPGVAFSVDGPEYEANGPFITIIDRPDVTDATIAQTVADAERDRLSGSQGRVIVETLEPGYNPGQTVEIDAPILVGATQDFLISEMRVIEAMVDAEQERTYVYELTCLQGNAYRENWREFWRRLRGEEGTGGTPAMPPEGCDGAVIWTDNFESGTALTADYTVTGSVTKTAGQGPDGSQACVIPDTFVVHNLRKSSLSFAGRRGCVTFDMLDNADSFGVGWKCIITQGASVIMECYNTSSPSFPLLNGLHIWSAEDDVTSASNALWTHGTYFRVRIEWRISTYLGPTGSAVDTDGYMRVYIDDVLAVSLENIKNYAYGPTSASQTAVTRIDIGGQDIVFDNLVIRDAD